MAHPENRSVAVRPPWSDPRVAHAYEWNPPPEQDVLDLNAAFRAYLTCPAVLDEVDRRTQAAWADLDGRERLDAAEVWALYRAARLLTVLTGRSIGGSLPDGALADYLHALGTTTGWYVTDLAAIPCFDDRGFAHKDALGALGAMFDAWLAESGVLEALRAYARVEVHVEDAGELPFAMALVRACKGAARAKVAIVCGVGMDPRLVRVFRVGARVDVRWPSNAALTRELAPSFADGTAHPQAGAYFRAHPDRRMRVIWQPSSAGGVRGTLARTLNALQAWSVPVALTFAPRLHPRDRDPKAGGFLFSALDAVLAHQAELASLDVSVRPGSSRGRARGDLADLADDQVLSEMLLVQALVELDEHSPISDRHPRTQLDIDTRLVGAGAHALKCHHDLEAIAAGFGGGVDQRQRRFGRGRPRVGSGPVSERARRATRYLLFVDLPFVVPVTRDNATYADVLSVFATPRRLRELLSLYEPRDREAIFALVDSLANTRILRRCA